ncbi:hypothetical protein [Streptomyces sp. NPDC059708]|uniref:hypothetical protein n=1 Tax=Streptomyces sp. NPDC059708 TaxID=3346916 RepID=UPI0036C706A7
MTSPPPEPDWRTVTAAAVGEAAERPAGMSRRRWRRQRAEELRATRAETTDAVRRSTPVGPAAVGVLALVVLGCGLFARCGADDHPAPPSSAAPAATAPDDPVPPTPSATTPAATTPEAAAGPWVRAWLTRDPVADRTWRAAVQRAAPWATRELTADLRRRPDQRWGAIVSAGEITRATAVTVAPAGGDLPPDAPGRVWRIVTATVDADGYVHATRTEHVTVEVMEMTTGWRVSRVLGA